MTRTPSKPGGVRVGPAASSYLAPTPRGRSIRARIAKVPGIRTRFTHLIVSICLQVEIECGLQGTTGGVQDLPDGGVESGRGIKAATVP